MGSEGDCAEATAEVGHVTGSTPLGPSQLLPVILFLARSDLQARPEGQVFYEIYKKCLLTKHGKGQKEHVSRPNLA